MNANKKNFFSRVIILLLTSLSSTALLANSLDKAKTIPTPNLLWSQSYLINTIFIQEYQALINSKASEDKNLKDFFSELRLQSPLTRAVFSLQSAKELGQRINNASDTSRTSNKHLNLYNKTKQASFKATASEVTKTFRSQKLIKHWRAFNPAFKNTATNCAIDFKTISDFANHQLALSKDGRTPNANELLAPIKNWKIPDLQCLVFAFMSASPKAKSEKGYEPLGLLMALRQTGATQAQDTVLRINTAIRLLQKSMYPESLRLLIGLQESNPAYRLAYDMIQRVYSIKQRGAGQVAIKGL